VFSAGSVQFSAAMLPVGGSTNFVITLAPGNVPEFTNVVTATTVTPEVNMADNQSTLISTQSFTSVLPNPPPNITSAFLQGDGSFTLNFSAGAGFTYILEATTNLIFPEGWQPIATNAAVTNGVLQFIDPQATNFPQRFYRLNVVPMQ
jgi:hypothetical protein